MMNSVVTRSLSGIVYIILIVASIFIGDWAFCLLTSLFTVLGVHEFYRMAHQNETSDGRFSLAEIIDVLGVLALNLSILMMPYGPVYIYLTFMMVLGTYVLARSIAALYDKGEHAYREVAKSVLGVIYVAVPMFMLNVLYNAMGDASHWFVLLMFIMIWLNDTGAYCFGSAFGRRRLFERLSPKKSWEGFWGGMGCCALFGVLCYYFFNHVGFSFVEWVALSLLICVFSTWGDLFESMLKRTVGVKDSGSIIPGHGGILDRIDSLLFVAPVTTIFFLLVTFF